MNREELIAYDKWLTRRKWGTGEIISPEKAADIYLAEHPLPPAEGAEQKKTCVLCTKPAMDNGLCYEHNICNVPKQPTAEDADEILDKYPHSIEYPSFVHENNAIAAMTEFATLHAQRIADKMKEANQFILDIAGVLGIETDGVGFDGLTLSIDDFKEAADKMVSERCKNCKYRGLPDSINEALNSGDGVYRP